MSSPLVTIMGFTFNIYGFLILLFFIFLLISIYRANGKKSLEWTDMITRDGSKVSTTKLLQLVGGVVATWVITQLTIQEKLTWDLFAIYLAYVASIDGYSKFILARYGVTGSDDSKAPYMRRNTDGSVGTSVNQAQVVAVAQQTTQTTTAVATTKTTTVNTDEIDDILPAGAAKPH